MGRHSAPRRHGPVVVLGAAAVIGSAGIVWAVGGGQHGTPTPSTVATRSGSSTGTARPVGTAPTPRRTGTSAPVVQVVPQPSQPAATASSSGPTTVATTPTVAPTAVPQPTRTKPGRGGPPSPKPTKTHQ